MYSSDRHAGMGVPLVRGAPRYEDPPVLLDPVGRDPDALEEGWCSGVGVVLGRKTVLGCTSGTPSCCGQPRAGLTTESA